MIGIDSDCIIDFLKGKEDAVKAVEKYGQEIVTTEINKFEVFFGLFFNKNVRVGEEQATNEFFEGIDSFSLEEGEEAAKLLADLFKRGRAVNQNDALIASILLNNGCDRIITRNEKHFTSIPGLKVVSY